MDITLLPIPEGTAPAVSVNKRRFSVGRSDGCDLLLPHQLVSREHAELLSDDGTVRVQDMGSRNGTYVNNQRIEGPVELHEGDTVAFAALPFAVHLEQCRPARPGGPRRARRYQPQKGR